MPDRLQVQNWILIPPSGRLALARKPLQEIPPSARLATGLELLAANRGNPFPWGHLPEPHVNNRQWREMKIGVGGLVHEKWFMTKDGRFGGAANVPQVQPGSLRCCMYLDGGGSPEDALAENEGFAVVRESSPEDQNLYRKVQLYAAKHVMADGGAIVCSPIGIDGKVFVGFVGRCQICPSAEVISFPQLCSAVTEYDFELWPEWKNWTLTSKQPVEMIPLSRAV